MSWISAVLIDIGALFVDDGRLAGAILGWLAVVGLLAAGIGADSRWTGLVLFVGLAVILLENTARRARNAKK